MQRTDRYAKISSDSCAMQLTTDGDDHCFLPVNKGIDENVPPSSPSEEQVTDNTKSTTSVSTNLNHKDLDASFETINEESIYDYDSTESSNSSLNHNTQNTSLVSGPYLTYWGPQDWLMHPSSYCKYMYRYLDMPFEFDVDAATNLPSQGPSYGAPDLAEIVKQIESYFSFNNLINDKNFREHMVGYGWVPLPFVASLPEVRKLTTNIKVIVEALRTSFAIEMVI
ncbi:hypothetical protein K1719_001661 [Acacia pycnantha]|nr:hypothetical protein K1719_001661 [Acacia pycnantha]